MDSNRQQFPPGPAWVPVRQMGRHNHLEPLPQTAAGQRHLVPANDLAAALHKRPKRRPPLPAGIEDGPVLQAALVLHGQLVAVNDGPAALALAHGLDERHEEAGGELLPGGRVELDQLDVEVGGDAHRQVRQHLLVLVPARQLFVVRGIRGINKNQ